MPAMTNASAEAGELLRPQSVGQDQFPRATRTLLSTESFRVSQARESNAGLIPHRISDHLNFVISVIVSLRLPFASFDLNERYGDLSTTVVIGITAKVPPPRAASCWFRNDGTPPSRRKDMNAEAMLVTHSTLVYCYCDEALSRVRGNSSAHQIWIVVSIQIRCY